MSPRNNKRPCDPPCGSSGLIGILNYDSQQISTGTVEQYKQYWDFPSLGDASILYIDKSSNTSYRWDNQLLKYYVVGNDCTKIKIIRGGDSTNG